MKILLADDHYLVLDGLELLLSTLDFVEKTGRADNYFDLKAELVADDYDLLLLDIHFGQHDGREIIGDIKKLKPNLKVVALTSHSDPATIKSAINSGFDGFLLKVDGREEMEKALKSVMNNERYYSSKTQQVFFESEIQPNHKVELTERELEILNLIVLEKTTKEIAAELFLSEKTIETHRGNIMLKLDARNIAGIVRKAILLGLVKV